MPQKKKTPQPDPGSPSVYPALLTPFADLAFPILPEPDLAPDQLAAITAALEQMLTEDADPIAVLLEGVDLVAASTALRRCAERMGLGVTFYYRAAKAAIPADVGAKGIVRHHGRAAVSEALMVARRKP